MMKLLKRYRYTLIALTALLLLWIFYKETGTKALSNTKNSTLEMIQVIPPIFILMGLLDVWIKKDTMVKYMGEGSGLKGMLLAILIGSAAAGPLYGAFPVAAVFMKKGVKFSNILLFIGAWSTTKIPMFLFEMASMGRTFAVTRLLINLPVIFFIALVIEKTLRKEDIDALYKNAENL